ncbi:MAG: thiol-activated cytolysin family protein [Bacteroidota bacterium]
MKNVLIDRPFSAYLAVFLSFLIISCNNEEMAKPEGTCSCDSIEALLDCPEAPDNVTEPMVTKSEPTVTDFDFQDNLICEQIEVNAMGATGEYRALSPNVDVIWPGNLLQGNTLNQGTPNEIAVKRAGGTLTIDLLNGSSGTACEKEEMSIDKVVECINEIIYTNNDTLAADYTYQERQVRSKEELATGLNVNINSIKGSFASQMAFSQDREYNRILVELVQKYYTIVYKTPTSYEEVFDPSVTPEQLEPFIQSDNPPVFIKSVTYGRQFYMLFETTSSYTDLQASVSGSFKAGLGNVSGGANVKKINELSDLNIKVFALGGDANLALAAARGDLDALTDFLNQGGNIRDGKPLSYKMKSLIPPYRDVGVNVTTNYTINHCRPYYSVQPPAFVQNWYGVFGKEGIGAGCAIRPRTRNVLLFNKAGTEYAQFVNDELQGIYDLQDPIGRLANCPFEEVGAVQSVMNDNIYVFDKSGLQWASSRPDGSWGAVGSISRFGNGSPFLNPPAGEPGTGATTLYTTGSGNSIVKNRAIHWNPLGTKWTVYDFANGNFSTIRNIEDYGPDTETIPFPNIGATLQVSLETPIFQERNPNSFYQVIFNAEGTKYTIYQDGANNGFTEVYDLAELD